MFHYQTPEELKNAAEAVGAPLPLADDLSILQKKLTFGKHEMHNRIVIQPMEGCDGTADGAPGELTIRRYDKFARSGAGLIWVEACAVLPEGRANPRQLWLTEDNLGEYKKLTARIRDLAIKEHGYAPLLILQATHSGRYSKPHGKPEPLTAYPLPSWETAGKSRILTDEEIERAEDAVARTARLAEEAGFDGVDVKCCHRYLGSELLSAFTRKGRYGGDFDNRTRYVRQAALKARQNTGADFIVTSRLNIYDGFPYPYGFGVKEGGAPEFDSAEPIRLVKALEKEAGMELIDITMGNPYVNPHVNRPADKQPYEILEDPLNNVERMVDGIGEVKAACPEMAVIGSALSYARQFCGNLAAGAIEAGKYDAAGFGRMAFAYPEFAGELLAGRALDAKKCCIGCGKCSRLMRLGSTAGCVVRDPYYTDLYRRLTAK